MELMDKIYFEEPIRDRFYNGYSEEETVILRYSGKIGKFSIRNLFKLVKPAERLVAKEEDIWLKNIKEEMEVLGKDGFEQVYEIIRRKVYEPLLVIETKTKRTIVCSSHQIPVKRDQEDILLKAEDLKEKDEVYVSDGESNGRYEEIVRIYPDNEERLSVYGMVTKTGGAMISDIFQKSY